MDKLEKNFIILRDFLNNEQITLLGVGLIKDLNTTFIELPEKIEEKLPYGISIGMRLSNEILNSLIDKPTKLYFHHYRQINNLLDKIAVQIVALIQSRGFNALPIPASQTVDWKEQRGHLSHKAVALKAGLGWIGLNNLLVNHDYGSQVRYISILTDFPLPVNEKSISSMCDTCKKCISICPAGAIKDRKEDFDRTACLKQLVQFSKECNIGHYICGLCVKVCVGMT